MKGIILNLVEETITDEHGEETWDALLDAAGLDGEYTSLGNYPDGDLVALVTAGAGALDVTADELTRHLGHQALLGLAARYPHYFAPHQAARELLLTLDEVIHAEVRKLYPESSPPDFWFDAADPELLVVHYRSERRLCALAEGMIRGTATYFGEGVAIAHDSCMLRGADHCTLRVAFTAS